MRALVLSLLAAWPAAAQEPGSTEARVRAAEVGPALDRVLRAAPAAELFALLAAVEHGVAAPLADGRAEAVRAALQGDRRGELFQALWPVASRPFDEVERLLAVDLVGAAGAGDQMTLLLAVAARGAPEPTPARVRAAFERATLRLLARSPAGLDSVPLLVSDAPADLLEPLIRSAGAIGAAALEPLSAALGRRPAAEMRLLAEIEAVGARAPHPVDPAVRLRVRAYLSSPSPLERIAAIGASASLEDLDALPLLIDALQDPMLAGFAEPALRRVTGKDFKRNAGAWRRWIDDELAWWNGPARQTLWAIAHGDAARASGAIAEVGGRRLMRHDLALGLVPGLWRREPELVARVCSKLASLGSRAPAPELVALLDHPDGTVREAAHQALCRITGKPYPVDDERWSIYATE